MYFDTYGRKLFSLSFPLSEVGNQIRGTYQKRKSKVISHNIHRILDLFSTGMSYFHEELPLTEALPKVWLDLPEGP